MLRSFTRTRNVHSLAVGRYTKNWWLSELLGPESSQKETSGPVDDIISVGGATLVASEWKCGPLPQIGPKLSDDQFTEPHPDIKQLAVARRVFAKHNDHRLRLDELIQKLGPSTVAVSSSMLNPNRWVVDEYDRLPQMDAYRLKTGPSRDLLEFISTQGITPVIVPPSEFPLTDNVFNRNGVRAAALGVRQSTNSVLMVSPTAFGFNAEAAEDNKFMDGSIHGDVGERALKEFEGLYRALTEKGIQVHLFEHSEVHNTPDAVFPNNWFTTHQAGEAFGALQSRSLVLYPLKCPNRRRERRTDAIQYLCDYIGYPDPMDMSKFENEERYFEGTGVMVLDRVNGVVYVAASERADVELAEVWADKMQYKEVVSFKATDAKGTPIYHTNVMMAIGTDFAVVCTESIADEAERKNLLAKLSRRHHVIEITLSQVNEFCGNILELIDGRGVPVVAMSTRALNAFTDDQKKSMFKNVAGIVDAPLDTIETVGGGGVRCTVAELF